MKRQENQMKQDLQSRLNSQSAQHQRESNQLIAKLMAEAARERQRIDEQRQKELKKMQAENAEQMEEKAKKAKKMEEKFKQEREAEKKEYDKQLEIMNAE